VYRGLQRRHRDAHMRRIGRDAILARAQNSQRPVVAGDGRTSSAGLALVAGHGCVSEVWTASALQQVPGDRSHVTDVRGRSVQNGLRQNRIISLDFRIIRQIGVTDSRADLQASLRRGFNLVERQTIDIQQARGSFHVQLHQIDQRRASAQEARRRTLMSRFDCAEVAMAAAASGGRMNSKTCIEIPFARAKRVFERIAAMMLA